MRRLLFAFLLVAALPASAQTDASAIPASAPAWQPMAAAVAQSKVENKVMLVHTYAVWCGWCSRMDQETYTDSTVQAFVAEHFTATRLDLESPAQVPFFEHTLSMSALGRAFGVTGTPTTVFVGPDGVPITKIAGYRDAPTLLLVMQYVHGGTYETESFQQYLDRANGVQPALHFDVPSISG
ncbi:MAG TPA: thioredoxin fold domain-containing protein [Rubricoccaceae bacterium]